MTFSHLEHKADSQQQLVQTIEQFYNRPIIEVAQEFLKRGKVDKVEIDTLTRFKYISPEERKQLAEWIDQHYIKTEKTDLSPRELVFIGMMHNYGIAYPENVTVAKEYFEKSKKAGEVLGTYFLTNFITDSAEKIKILLQIKNDCPVALGPLVSEYYKIREFEKAKVYLEEGEKLNLEECLRHLATESMTRETIKEYYNRAIQQGSFEALANLAELYLFRVPRDVVLAKALLEACLTRYPCLKVIGYLCNAELMSKDKDPRKAAYYLRWFIQKSEIKEFHDTHAHLVGLYDENSDDLEVCYLAADGFNSIRGHILQENTRKRLNKFFQEDPEQVYAVVTKLGDSIENLYNLIDITSNDYNRLAMTATILSERYKIPKNITLTVLPYLFPAKSQIINDIPTNEANCGQMLDAQKLMPMKVMEKMYGQEKAQVFFKNIQDTKDYKKSNSNAYNENIQILASQKIGG